ncbi:MAG: YcgN family cysteine cluster protein [Rhodospirillales bacterium]|nr:YcgN family cysteine cluster protein [Rhodospirillales bacterium]
MNRESPTEQPFWKTKPLERMSRAEWESLCDGCGKCCLEKLEDADTGAISYTNVACRLLDIGTCRCSRYSERHRFVPNCEKLDASSVRMFSWLPSTCAYRLLAEGKDLPFWHHLISMDPELVHRVGASVRGRAVPENRAGPLEHHIVTWPA